MPFYHEWGIAMFDNGDIINAGIAGDTPWYSKDTLRELERRKLCSKERSLQLTVLVPFALSKNAEILTNDHPEYIAMLNRLIVRANHQAHMTPPAQQ